MKLHGHHQQNPDYGKPHNKLSGFFNKNCTGKRERETEKKRELVDLKAY